MTEIAAGTVRDGESSRTPARAQVVQGRAGFRTEQGTGYVPAISAEAVGASALWMGIVTLPPGQRTKAHVHERHESAFHMLSGGEVEIWSGERLEHREVARPGDFLFVPANVPHVAVNRGAAPAVFVGARNEPSAREDVAMRPDLDAMVP